MNKLNLDNKNKIFKSVMLIYFSKFPWEIYSNIIENLELDSIFCFMISSKIILNLRFDFYHNLIFYVSNLMNRQYRIRRRKNIINITKEFWNNILKTTNKIKERSESAPPIYRKIDFNDIDKFKLFIKFSDNFFYNQLKSKSKKELLNKKIMVYFKNSKEEQNNIVYENNDLLYWNNHIGFGLKRNELKKFNKKKYYVRDYLKRSDTYLLEEINNDKKVEIIDLDIFDIDKYNPSSRIMGWKEDGFLIMFTFKEFLKILIKIDVLLYTHFFPLNYNYGFTSRSIYNN